MFKLISSHLLLGEVGEQAGSTQTEGSLGSLGSFLGRRIARLLASASCSEEVGGRENLAQQLAGLLVVL